jgi:formiminotetrahydrofolate cyclodeaminase
MSNPRDLRDASIRDFLTAFGSADAAHGVVSAAALAGSLGASLLQKVAGLPMTRSDSAADRTALLAASTDLRSVLEQLLETIETETAVRIYAAQNSPQATAAERTERDARIQLALRAAADVPLEVMRLCALGLQHAQTVAARSSRAAAAEVQLGVALLRVAFTGARSNLDTRLSSLTDVLHTKAIVEEIARLNEDAARTARAAELAVQVPPA